MTWGYQKLTSERNLFLHSSFCTDPAMPSHCPQKERQAQTPQAALGGLPDANPHLHWFHLVRQCPTSTRHSIRCLIKVRDRGPLLLPTPISLSSQTSTASGKFFKYLEILRRVCLLQRKGDSTLIHSELHKVGKTRHDSSQRESSPLGTDFLCGKAGCTGSKGMGQVGRVPGAHSVLALPSTSYQALHPWSLHQLAGAVPRWDHLKWFGASHQSVGEVFNIPICTHLE